MGQMATDTQMTIRVSAEALTTIVAAAAREGVSAEHFASDLIQHFADEEAQLSADIAEGRRQIAAGEYLTHEELVEEIQRWKRDLRQAA